MSAKHPGPWGSLLWNHIEEIRSLRIQRKRWKDIAEHLEKERGVKTSARAVRNFFVRSRNPKLRLPAGLEHLRAHSTATVPPPAATSPGPPARREDLIDPLSTEESDERPKFKINQP
jgi:hypothetical protein